MRLTSTNPGTWASVATLLTAMAFGCEGADGGASAQEAEFARKAAAFDDGGDTPDGEGGGDVASLDGGVSASAPDGGEPALNGDVSDAAIGLTDNQIFGILVAYNDAELSAAASGDGKLQSSAALALATTAARSANASKARQSVLARLAGLTPDDSDQSTDRERIASEVDTMLETESPSDSLDLRYAFAEAMTNQQLVQLIDGTLLPQADSELLKSELRVTRDTARLRVTEGGNVVTALAPAVTPEATKS